MAKLNTEGEQTKTAAPALRLPPPQAWAGGYKTPGPGGLMALVYALSAFALLVGGFRWHELGYDWVGALCVGAAVILLMCMSEANGDKRDKTKH